MSRLPDVLVNKISFEQGMHEQRERSKVIIDGLEAKLAAAIEALKVYAADGFFHAMNGQRLDENSARLVHEHGSIARDAIAKIEGMD